DFHTYAIEWQEGEIRWYIDGYLYQTQRQSVVRYNSKEEAVGLVHRGWFAEYYDIITGEMTTHWDTAPFDQNFFLILNFAVGGDWPINVNDLGIDASAFANGQSFVVDYIRVYECSIDPDTGKGCETVRGGYDSTDDALVEGLAPIPSPPSTGIAEDLIIFNDANNPAWTIWGDEGPMPTVETDDAEHGAVAQFVIDATPTVMGFSTREAHGAVGGVAFDASPMLTTGNLSFDMKVVTPPSDGTALWNLKLESPGKSSEALILLSESNEGVAPVTGEWQTYTFSLQALTDAGLDLSAIDIVMIFPDWGKGDGAVYRVDNVEISAPGGGAVELLTNGDFETGDLDSWNDTGTVVTGGTNYIYQADVAAAGNPWDVNLSQVIELTEGETYTLSFKAKAGWDRVMIAGLGLNGDPWTNSVEDISLTTEWQTFTYEIVVTGFGSANSRVIFDMGHDVGVVNIDDVSLKLNGVGPELLTNGDFQTGGLDSWTNVGTVEEGVPNSMFEADISAAGNPWDVNLSQIIPLAEGETYILTFEAKASKTRTMLAGLGLNEAPWTNYTEEPTLTTEWQTFTYEIFVDGFGSDASRVIFDMGADTGVINIDNVSVTLKGSGGSAGLVLYQDETAPLWAYWGDAGQTPTEETDDAEYGTTVEFVIGGTNTVMGFTSRESHGVTGGVPFDASAYLTTGVVQFDMKVISEPTDASAVWLLKIEAADGTSSYGDAPLNTSTEGLDPVTGEWQTYTFSLQDLSDAGLDISAIDVVMIFPSWGKGDGAVYRVDNVIIGIP
ncbi:MAG: family 16 glycosylhydrolase, partial [Gammaproteobacteria bacterium]|nr:family 16 glycosylhydrolase [Gammaproteobacteria bacterium]